MSISRRITFAVSASWFSRLVTISLNLILIPVLFRQMGQEELGIWFMLGQSGAFLGLMDLGVSPTLTRRIAFAKGKSGGDPNADLNTESKHEIVGLVASGQLIYRFLTLGVFFIAWTTGFLFIDQIELKQLDYQTVWIAWTVMCLSHAVGVWAGMWGCLLQGLGYVGWDAVLGTLINIFTLCIQIAVVIWGGGLIELAVVATIGGLATRFGTWAFIRNRQPQLFAFRGKWDARQIKSMVNPALSAWLTGLGGFLILKTDQYFIVYFQSAAEIPAYHAAYQLVSNLFVLGVSVSYSSTAFISHLWQAERLQDIYSLVKRGLRFGMLIMLYGTTFLLMVGDSFIKIWLGEGHFIGYPILLVFCLTLGLHSQGSMLMAMARATENEKYSWMTLLSGLLNMVFTYFFITFFGLLGVALGTLCAQLLTLNWFCVLTGLKRLKISLRIYFYDVLMPCFIYFIPVLLVYYFIRHFIVFNPEYTVVIWSLLFFLVCLLGSLYILVLEVSEQKSLIKKLNFLFLKSAWRK